MRTLVAAAAFLALVALPAKADRPVTEAERARLGTAAAAQNCAGGEMEWDEDNREFEVDARCADGQTYELKFDADYTFKSKKLDD